MRSVLSGDNVNGSVWLCLLQHILVIISFVPGWTRTTVPPTPRGFSGAPNPYSSFWHSLQSIIRSAYFHSTTTLNYIRALLTSGFASLHHPRDWSLSHVRSPALRAEFERVTEGLSDALDFTRTIGVGRQTASYEEGGPRGALGEVDFYTRSVLSLPSLPSPYLADR